MLASFFGRSKRKQLHTYIHTEAFLCVCSNSLSIKSLFCLPSANKHKMARTSFSDFQACFKSLANANDAKDDICSVVVSGKV